MNPNRLTLEEVNEFNPTMDNPLVVECDDGYYLSELKNIKIVSRVHKGRFIFISSSDKLDYSYAYALGHYPSQKQPAIKKKVFYQMLVKDTLDPQSCWTIPDHLFDESFKDSTGREIYSDRYIRILLTDRPIEIEVDELSIERWKESGKQN